MNFDLTISISVILALSAILSPIAVAIINNRHNIKIKRLEINEKYVISSFQDYLSKLEQCIALNGSEHFRQYSEAYGQALLYASLGSKKLMKEIDDIIQSSDSKNLSKEITSEMIFTLSSNLRSDIRRVKQ